MKILEWIHGFLWGAPVLVLIIGVGIYLTVGTGFAQIRLFPRAMGDFFRKLTGKTSGSGTLSSFQALCTALAATVGTGNLIGVAGALCLGGPGSIFWMWVCGLLGMVTKFTEATLAVRFRTRENGEYRGGPMYMIASGLGQRWRWLGMLYSFFGVTAAFGVGNTTQINGVISGVNRILENRGISPSLAGNFLMGLLLAAAVGGVLLGGVRRIGVVAEKLVPLVSAGYILLCLGVLILRWDGVGAAFRAIFQGAFSPKAATGGVLGSGFLALRVGCSRGVFTNEAGMGTASMAHASADVTHPVGQGLMGIVEVFLDTIVICTLTALVILVSGVAIPYGVDAGGTLTNDGFSAVYGQWVTLFLTAALCCFAFATVLGWGLYGARCAEYLFGKDSWKGFAWAQTATVVIGAVLNTEFVWLLAEILNGLMAIPNLIALILLSPELFRLTKNYSKKP